MFLTGVKCNLVVYKPVEESSGENCYLFNCPSEQDCPLMTAGAGVNTYNIFRGQKQQRHAHAHSNMNTRDDTVTVMSQTGFPFYFFKV